MVSPKIFQALLFGSGNAANSHTDSANEYLLEDFSGPFQLEDVRSFGPPRDCWVADSAKSSRSRCRNQPAPNADCGQIMTNTAKRIGGPSNFSKEAALSHFCFEHKSCAWFVTAPPLPETMRLASLTISFMSLARADIR